MHSLVHAPPPEPKPQNLRQKSVNYSHNLRLLNLNECKSEYSYEEVFIMSCSCMCNICPIAKHCVVAKHNPAFKKTANSGLSRGPKKIVAYTAKDKIPCSLSNYMPGCNLGYDEATKEFRRIINNLSTADEICQALNLHRWTADKFSTYTTLPNGFILKATDFLGNITFIRITQP